MVRKDYLVCVDSDGCAMDTMNSKHEQCFGPAMVEIWGLEEKREEVLECWNRVNLFSETRGINRFLALCMVLEEAGAACVQDGYNEFKEWTRHTRELSSDSLKQWMKDHDTNCCRKACDWSALVNEKISRMPKEENKSFPGVLRTLKEIHKAADIAVVSSANKGAVTEEWEREGLLPHVDLVMTQENGSKSECIRELLGMGYEPGHVLMAGDAPGDLKAARENGVLFYPILAKKEEASWKEMGDQVLSAFLNGTYGICMEQEAEAAFHSNLQMLSRDGQDEGRDDSRNP